MDDERDEREIMNVRRAERRNHNGRDNMKSKKQ